LQIYILLLFSNKNYKFVNKIKLIKEIGDWGLGIGDWGLGIGDWARSPIPNPHNLNKIIKIF